MTKAQKTSIQNRQLSIAKRKIQSHVCFVFKIKRAGLSANEAIKLYCRNYKKHLFLDKDGWLLGEYYDTSSQLSMVVLPKKEKNTIIKNSNNIEIKGFYDSDNWQYLRKLTLDTYGCVCMKCHAKNTEMHVDHIKPRSKYPELELDKDNLQVLCKSCNMEKSNNNEIDYRTKNIPIPIINGDIIIKTEKLKRPNIPQKKKRKEKNEVKTFSFADSVLKTKQERELRKNVLLSQNKPNYEAN